MAHRLRSSKKKPQPGHTPNRPRKYVVLMGDVGTGKSTILEKVARVTGRSSDSDESFTNTSEYLPSLDGNLLICDTPGSNAMADTFMQNMWIAEAMNLQPVSKILVTVQANTRIDNVVKAVEEYSQRFIDMDDGLLGVIVTHMDEVRWTKESCKNHLFDQLGITDVIFSGKDEQGKNLCRYIADVCKKEYDLNINSQNFLKLFKINDRKQKIARSTKRQVDDFRALVNAFYEERNQFETSPKDMADLIFDFQAWMKIRIEEAKKKVATENKFTYHGESANNEFGHIANMTNQLAEILRELRNEALGYQENQRSDMFRKCPYCNLVWEKVEGCNDETECGARPEERPSDVRQNTNSIYGTCVLGTFTFNWEEQKLKITKGDNKEIIAQTTGNGVGCGNIIIWKEMRHVDVPSEIWEKKPINVEDVPVIPEKEQLTWQASYDSASNQVKELMRNQNEEKGRVHEELSGDSSTGVQLSPKGGRLSLKQSFSALKKRALKKNS